MLTNFVPKLKERLNKRYEKSLMQIHPFFHCLLCLHNKKKFPSTFVQKILPLQLKKKNILFISEKNCKILLLYEIFFFFFKN